MHQALHQANAGLAYCFICVYCILCCQGLLLHTHCLGHAARLGKQAQQMLSNVQSNFSRIVLTSIFVNWLLLEIVGHKYLVHRCTTQECKFSDVQVAKTALTVLLVSLQEAQS